MSLDGEAGPQRSGPHRRLPEAANTEHRRRYVVTSIVTVVVCVTPPPLPVTVIVRFPSGATLLAFTVMVDVPAPGFAIELGAKLTLRLPSPEADKLIGESKPPEIVVVIVDFAEPSLATLIEPGDALTVKLPVPVTFRKTM